MIQIQICPCFRKQGRASFPGHFSLKLAWKPLKNRLETMPIQSLRKWATPVVSNQMWHGWMVAYSLSAWKLQAWYSYPLQNFWEMFVYSFRWFCIFRVQLFLWMIFEIYLKTQVLSLLGHLG